MNNKPSASNILNTLVLVTLSIIITACGGGGSSAPAVTPPHSDEPVLLRLSIVSPNSPLKVGDSFQTTATAFYSDDSSLEITDKVVWNTTNNNILTVSNSGMLTAVSPGETNLNSSYEDKTANALVKVIGLETLSINSIPDTLTVGDTFQLSATGTYSDGSTEEYKDQVNWTSSNDAAFAVDASGLLSIKSAGRTTISASLDNLSTQESIEIVVLDSLTMSKLPDNIEVGNTHQLEATSHYSNGNSNIVTASANWSSSNTDVFNVTDTGLVTAVSPGTAIISASFEDKTASSGASTSYALETINTSPPILTLALASSQKLEATGLYTNSSSRDLSTEATWSSSNNSIATVDSNGVVNAISAGNAIITASIGAISSTSNLTVSPATLHSIEIKILDSLVAGLSTPLSAIGTFSDGSIQDITKDLNWQTSNNSIATVSNNEYILQALASGSITIFASKDSVSAEMPITISPAQIDNIVLTPPSISLAKGTQAEVNVTAIMTDQSHIDVTDQVNWRYEKEGVIAIEQGTTNISAVEVGTSRLIAELNGLNSGNTITVTDAILTEINLLPINNNVPKGLSIKFSALGTYSDGSVQDITDQVIWSSADTDIASISNASLTKGLATGTEQGQTSISATLKEINATTSLHVQDAVLTSIQVIPNNITLAKGLQTQVLAMGTYSDGETIDLSTEVNWNSSNSAVSSVINPTSPFIDASTEGEALISAKMDDVSGISSITVTNATLQTITLSTDNTVIPLGFSEQVSATGEYTDSSTEDITHLVTWQSSDNSVLTIDNNSNSPGLIRTASTGTSTISASLDSISASLSTEVTDALLSSLTITSPKTSLNINDTAQFNAVASYSDNSTKDVTQEVNWYSSASDIASIETASNDYFSNNRGLLKALSVGTTEISAQLLSNTGQLIISNTQQINISEDPNAIKAISLAFSPNIILNNGVDSTFISAMLTPNSADGEIADNTEVTFTIVDNNLTRTETALTTNGTAQISITSANEGLISISATSGTKEASGAVYSTSDLSKAVVVYAYANAEYDEINEILKSGSSLGVLSLNISNRNFTIPSIAIMKGAEQPELHLEGSPIDTSLVTSDQSFAGGRTASFLYTLTRDEAGRIFYFLYAIHDPITNTNFLKGSIFSFQ